MKAPDADLYLHEMPGGQFTNLLEQAKALGLGDRWEEVCKAYADCNQLLGDIVKVTPTSKSVGDLALLLVTNGMQASDLLSDSRELSFPESVVDLLAGRMGQPPGGFPPAVVKRIVRSGDVVTGRPGESLPPADFTAAAKKVEPHGDGTRTVFFELNGQPRSVSVADKSLEAKVQRRPKAVIGDAREVGAPMPGLIVTVAVKPGDTVAKGQKLLSLEAMKMETTVYAERDGRIGEVLVAPGTPVEAGELVARYADA
jgi:pyruvate carboxylase